MTALDPKADFHRYLQEARDALVWKLDGLSDYDVRRPLVPAGTNLLGLVKHVAYCELGYFCGQIIGLCRRAWRHSDATIDALPLDATGPVPR